MTLRRSIDLLLLAVALTACSAADKVETPKRVDPATTEVARLATIPDVYETTGTVRARTTSQLAAKVIGNVTRVLVSEGDAVRRGQLLLTIDSREADAMLTRARAGSVEIDRAIEAATAAESAAAANAKFARATYERYRVLRERDSVSAHELEGIEAQQKSAAAELERAAATRQQLLAQKNAAIAGVATASTFADYDEIRSPIDGVVTSKHVDVGSQAAPGMVLMTVEDTSQIRIDAFVPESIAASLSLKTAAEIDGASARIAQIVPAFDPMTRTALVKLDSDAALRGGQSVRVRFAIGERRAVVVPSEAIRTRGQLRQLQVVGSDGAAQMRLVTTGRTFAGATEILAGLDEGERYVAGGPR